MSVKKLRQTCQTVMKKVLLLQEDLMLMEEISFENMIPMSLLRKMKKKRTKLKMKNEEEEDEEEDDDETDDENDEEYDDDSDANVHKIRPWDMLMNITSDNMQDRFNETVEKTLEEYPGTDIQKAEEVAY